jgi:hypothetical protein
MDVDLYCVLGLMENEAMDWPGDLPVEEELLARIPGRSRGAVRKRLHDTMDLLLASFLHERLGMSPVAAADAVVEYRIKRDWIEAEGDLWQNTFGVSLHEMIEFVVPLPAALLDDPVAIADAREVMGVPDLDMESFHFLTGAAVEGIRGYASLKDRLGPVQRVLIEAEDMGEREATVAMSAYLDMAAQIGRGVPSLNAAICLTNRHVAIANLLGSSVLVPALDTPGMEALLTFLVASDVEQIEDIDPIIAERFLEGAVLEAAEGILGTDSLLTDAPDDLDDCDLRDLEHIHAYCAGEARFHAEARRAEGPVLVLNHPEHADYVCIMARDWACAEAAGYRIVEALGVRFPARWRAPQDRRALRDEQLLCALEMLADVTGIRRSPDGTRLWLVCASERAAEGLRLLLAHQPLLAGHDLGQWPLTSVADDLGVQVGLGVPSMLENVLAEAASDLAARAASFRTDRTWRLNLPDPLDGPNFDC